MATPDFSDDTFLARWLAGELLPEELRTLEARPDFRGYQRLVGNMARMQVPTFDTEAEFVKLKAARESRSQVKPDDKPALQVVRGKRSWVQPLLAVAATIALVLAVWFLLPGAEPEFIAAAGDQRTEVELSDGSTVQLNAVSTLDFSSTDVERSAELSGEGYFNVEKSSVPFVIRTELGEVTVVGTSFNVFTRGDSMRVSVASGQVRVMFKEEAEPFTLTPGQSVSRWVDGTTVTGGFEESEDLDWLGGRSVFINRPLREVLDELERQFDLTIVRPPRLDLDARYDIIFPNDQLDLALQNALDPIRNYRYAQSQETITLVPID